MHITCALGIVHLKLQVWLSADEAQKRVDNIFLNVQMESVFSTNKAVHLLDLFQFTVDIYQLDFNETAFTAIFHKFSLGVPQI